MSNKKKASASRSSSVGARRRKEHELGKEEKEEQATLAAREHKSPPRARDATGLEADDALPLRRRNNNRRVEDTPESNGATFMATDPEVDLLQSRIQELQEEKDYSAAVVSALAEQNWEYLIDRSRRIKEEFDSRMESLIGDVEALCEYSSQQKQKTAEYTPARSRARSLASAADVASTDKADTSASPPGAQTAATSGTSPSPAPRESLLKQKEFIWRDSQLTAMFRTSPDIRTIYHMFVAVMILFAMKVFINDFFNLRDPNAKPGQVTASIHFFFWNFGKTATVIRGWIAMAATHFLILPIMWAWRRERIGDVTYSLLYLLHQAVFIGLFASVIVSWNLPVASSMIMLCEQTRMVMKTHSFWRETLRIKYAPKDVPAGVNAHCSNSAINSHLLPTFRDQLNQFILFFFVPTLIYRNSYPRTRTIRWNFVATCVLEVLGCIFYLYIIFTGFCVPEFKATAANPGDIKALSVSLFNSALPGIAVYLLAFFGLLHCWMNLFAELTRFADRLFYQDWWNTTTFSSYYRKWNMIVHDSLYNYIYVDARRLGVPQGACFFLTFLLSAIVHEYIIALSLKFFYPVLLVMFLVFGVSFVYLTKCLGTNGRRSWNVFFWANLIIGNGILLIMYSREYYARQPQLLAGAPGGTKPYVYDPNSWLPYSWQPFLK